jgi:endonuclease-3
MTTPNRTALLNKLHKVLKKHYKPAANRHDQPVLESLLFAACLENARPATAELVFEKLKTSFFDWNEVRVSTVRELAEIMHDLGDPESNAGRVKGILQSVFESEYSFDLESLKKKNLGDAVKRLQKLDGATPFVVAYAVQTSLGGHSIPIDRGTLGAMYVLGVISESESTHGNVSGMERAIPKSKGQEFGSLLHQLGAEFAANPFSQPLRDLLLSISPDAKDRFPKRVTKKPVPAPAQPAPEPAAAKKGAKDKPREPEKSKDKSAPAAKKPALPAKKGSEPAMPAKKSAEPAAPAKKSTEPGRAAEPHKKKTLVTKSKPAAKPLAKRKPR